MQQRLLADDEDCIVPELAGADLRLWPHWLPLAGADRLFEQLRRDIPFTQHRLRMFGREVDAPRLSCWIGDPQAVYRYSGTRFMPHPWPHALIVLRDRVQTACGASFNSVLANLYRDGDDAMGWHSDDEPELGEAPIIASVSLGAERSFRLRARDGSGQNLDLKLPHGSLLCMAGATQRNYRHALPRSRRVAGARLNLTFRHVA